MPKQAYTVPCRASHPHGQGAQVLKLAPANLPIFLQRLGSRNRKRDVPCDNSSPHAVTQHTTHTHYTQQQDERRRSRETAGGKPGGQDKTRRARQSTSLQHQKIILHHSSGSAALTLSQLNSTLKRQTQHIHVATTPPTPSTPFPALLFPSHVWETRWWRTRTSWSVRSISSPSCGQVRLEG